MAENTFTVDTSPQTETLTDNLTPDEQDSLKVGEEIVDQQEQLLAGKYKTAQDLEKAYKELESKLGEQSGQENVEQTSAEDETEETSLSDGATLITSANDEFNNNDGKLSPETMEKFSAMSSKELVEAYLEVQGTDAFQQAQGDVPDLSDAEINQVKNSVGGETAYDNIIKWASNTLDKQTTEAFDSIVNTGSVQAIQMAVAGLKTQYDNANGYEGKMYTGKAPVTPKDVYRSQAELVAAMNDKRYDNDPAYRQDVIEKLERSDLNF